MKSLLILQRTKRLLGQLLQLTLLLAISNIALPTGVEQKTKLFACCSLVRRDQSLVSTSMFENAEVDTNHRKGLPRIDMLCQLKIIEVLFQVYSNA